MSYQPKTGARCRCKRGVQRDNCPSCEGTGWVIDFKRIRNMALDALRYHVTGAIERGEKEAVREITPGQRAYEEDVRRMPTYYDGAPRVTWGELSPAFQANWERNPTPRDWGKGGTR